MRQLLLILCLATLGFAVGCASDNKKSSWDAAKKDLRGDNMQMKSNFHNLSGGESFGPSK